jgi:hypothetical protein
VFDKDLKGPCEKFLDIEKMEKGKVRFRIHARNGYKAVILLPEDIRKMIEYLESLEH